MDIIIVIIQIVAATFGSLAALASTLLFVALRWPAPVWWVLKLYVAASSSLLGLSGVLITIVGLTTGSTFVALIGILDVLIFSTFVSRVTQPPDVATGFEHAFGSDWEKSFSPAQAGHFLHKRTSMRLPAVSDPRMEQNISFATIPATDRRLLCDLWQPPENVAPSGLAFIYLHGSAFYLLDKDFGTRPMFRYLAAQGHVIMDVAYRLSPETDIMGMVHDVNRAIEWMKENAHTYGVNPNRIVLGGGSAGGHLALLTSYAGNKSQFVPGELQGKDLSVCAVISLYGTYDLEEVYYHTNQHLTTRSTPDRPKKAVPTTMPAWIVKSMGEEYHRLGFDKGFENAGALPPLLGGHPDECPETYALFSPLTHVHSACPPTLLIHGEHDIMAPVKSARRLYARLVEHGVRTILHLLPQTDHAFDLIMPKISPVAHNALYDVERFMALQVKSHEKREMMVDV